MRAVVDDRGSIAQLTASRGARRYRVEEILRCFSKVGRSLAARFSADSDMRRIGSVRRSGVFRL